MADAADLQRDLGVLQNMIEEAILCLEITPPQNGIARARELMTNARMVAESLRKDEVVTPAKLGSLGGKKTAERGSEYFKQASMS